MTDETGQQLAPIEGKPLKNEIAMQPTARGGRQLAPENASQAMVFAQMMARSMQAVPDRFRDNPGLCLGVTMDAMTFGFNPFALARSAYIVSGAIGYEAKAYVAALNASGFLKSRLKFSYTGEIKGTHEVRAKDGKRTVPAGTLKCKIVGEVHGEDEPLEWETPELGQIEQKGSPLWSSDPKLQLYYYGVRAWARVYLPEVMMGIQTRDEIEDIGETALPPAPAPKPTLIERVKERRAASEKNPDAATIEGSLPAAQAPVDVEAGPVEANAETVETDSPPPVKRVGRKKAAPAPDPEPAKEASEPEAPAEEIQPPAPAAEEPGRPKTTEEALDMLRVSVSEKSNREDVETAKLDWMLLITHFTREEQFDLQAAADEIVARRRLAIGRRPAGV